MKRKLLLIFVAFMLSLGLGFSQLNIPQPCTPTGDPCNLAWTDLQWITYNISPDCEVIAYFVTRACPPEPIIYEIQILAIVTYGNCSQIPLSLLIQSSFQQIANYENTVSLWPPYNLYDCYDYWQFDLASCFVTLTYSGLQLPPPNTGLYQINLPCDGSGCCQQQIRACKINGGVTLQPIGDLVGSSDCKDAHWPDLSHIDPRIMIPPCPPNCPSESDCNPHCDDLKLKDLQSGRIGNYFINDIEDGININTFIGSNKQTLILNIDSKNKVSLIVRINDLKGREIGIFNLNETMGFNTNEIDISTYLTGAYLVNIYNNDKLIKTEKILILK